VHCRRGFFEAQGAEPQAAAQALEQIGALYEIERQIRQDKLEGQAKRIHRLTHSKPLVDEFFAWVDQRLAGQGLLPSNPLTKALAYARARRAALEVFLVDADVPMDTNHLERALRAIPMGRRNWLFCWTEVGARHAGVVQSLITTCRLHGIDPYTYFVDVLQRVGQHPAARVAELTPRLWKQHFADNPLRSALHGLSG
jgi:transposase